jgi:dUTP pyrophosphatase
MEVFEYISLAFIVVIVLAYVYASAHDTASPTDILLALISSNKPKALKIKYVRKSGQGLVAPYKLHKEDAGADLSSTSVEEKTVNGRKAFVYNLGIAVEIPEGHVGLIFPRSSICKTGATLANSVGVIDSNYRGELKAVFYAEEQPYTVGERCCQLIIIPYPSVTYVEAHNLTETNRGSGGFGSTGK